MSLVLSIVLALSLQGSGELALDRAATWGLLQEALATSELPVAEARLGEIERFGFEEGAIVGLLYVRLAPGLAESALPFRATPELDRRWGRWKLRLVGPGETTLLVDLPDRLSWELGPRSELRPRIQRVRVEESRLVLELGFSRPGSPARGASR